jgi:hypothetical protein
MVAHRPKIQLRKTELLLLTLQINTKTKIWFKDLDLSKVLVKIPKKIY